MVRVAEIDPQIAIHEVSLPFSLAVKCVTVCAQIKGRDDDESFLVLEREILCGTATLLHSQPPMDESSIK